MPRQDWHQERDDPCVAALRGDDAEKLARELEKGRALDARFHYDRTLLHIAAQFGAAKCAEVLLAKGADLEARSKDDRTPLSYAVGHGKTEFARILLKRGARLAVAIPAASSQKREELEAAFRQLTETVAEDVARLTPLIGEEFGVPERREELIESFVDTLSAPHTNHVLDDCNDFETLRLLVEECGCDPNRHDGGGEWPLKRFAAAKDVEAIKFLLARGARVDFTSTGDTALHAAVAADGVECARLLLEAGANPNQQDCDGCVPMSRVSSHAMLDLLLEFGADPNIGDQCDLKPWHWVDEPTLKERLLKMERRDPEEEAQFQKGDGELAQFILDHARKRGVKTVPAQKSPAVSTDWKYFEDADGVVIELAPEAFPKVELFLRKVFGEPSQRCDGTTDGGSSGYYAGKQFGAHVSFSVNALRTQVVILGKRRMQP